MRNILTCFFLALIIPTFAGCGDRQKIGKSDYAVVHPESWNPDGHPGIFLYYKRTEIWVNVICSDEGYHDGIFVFLGDIPGSLFNGDLPIQYDITDYSRSMQLFATRGAGPPVIISERLFNHSLKTNLPITVQGIKSGSNGLNVDFRYEPKPNSKDVETNLFVSWQEIQDWLHEAETSTPVQKCRKGNYRFLPMKQL